MALSRPLKLISTLAAALCGAAFLAGCEDEGTRPSEYRAFAPLSSETLELMRVKNTDQNAPMLIRAYKKEAELEIWKQKKDGKYVKFRTYPMCRWSGQLGPKVTEGDRQVPEGFYTITPGQMNPNSHYYLSFNVGFPNAYDRANGHTGGSIMVHGICSSAGCFSMTDKQIEEIYAVARESFAGGQHAIQMQSYPFHMTADNLAKLRLDPNMPFWRELKKGSDYFEVTKLETPVGVCGKKYVFGATPKTGRFDALSSCPPLVQDPDVQSAVNDKAAVDDRDVAELVSKGVKPVRIVYADGGQNETFKSQNILDVSRPDALAAGATEVALDDAPKARPVAVQVAAYRANQSKAAAAKVDVPASKPIAVASVAAPGSGSTVVPATFTAAPSAYAKEEPKPDSSFLGKWINVASASPDPAPAQPVQAAPPASDATASVGTSKKVVAKLKADRVTTVKTPVAVGTSEPASTAAPAAAPVKSASWLSGLMAFSPLD